MKSEIITVTPLLAAEWLKNNITNRPLAKAKDYADDMKAGRWRLTHQGIAFNTKGQLIDGQNRLTAVIMSGCHVPMVVFFDCEPQSVDVLDIGKARTLGDVLKMRGVANANITAGIASKILAYENGKSAVLNSPSANTGQLQSGGFKPSTRKAQIEFFESNKDKLIECSHFAVKVYSASSSRLLSPADIGFLYWLFGMNRDANEFISTISTGLNIQESTAQYHMRRILEEAKNKMRIISSAQMMRYWLAAWEKRNIPVKKLIMKSLGD